METKILEQLAQFVLPKEILERFAIVKIDTDERNIDAMSMTIHLRRRNFNTTLWSRIGKSVTDTASIKPSDSYSELS